MLVPEEMRKCVVFIGFKDDDGRFIPKATGFFVLIDELDMTFPFLVTAHHVVAAIRSKNIPAYLRVNRIDGGADEILIPDLAWMYDPDARADVVFCPIHLGEEHERNAFALDAYAISDEAIRDNSIGVGEEINIIGLFRSHYGKERNIPIVRTGNIAAMDEEPVFTKSHGYVDAYLIEARSIGGLSGSPVFVNLAPYRVVDSVAGFTQGQQFYLLGLMHGHFDIRDLNSDAVDDKPFEGAGDINTGVGIVIPAKTILAVINHPEMRADRIRYIEHERATRGGATAE